MSENPAEGMIFDEKTMVTIPEVTREIVNWFTDGDIVLFVTGFQSDDPARVTTRPTTAGLGTGREYALLRMRVAEICAAFKSGTRGGESVVEALEASLANASELPPPIASAPAAQTANRPSAAERLKSNVSCKTIVPCRRRPPPPRAHILAQAVRGNNLHCSSSKIATQSSDNGSKVQAAEAALAAEAEKRKVVQSELETVQSERVELEKKLSAALSKFVTRVSHCKSADVILGYGAYNYGLFSDV